MLDPHQLPEALNVTQVFLYERAAEQPDAPAIVTDSATITYAQLVDATDRASAVYRALGLEPEQRVLLMLPDVPAFASAWFAAVKVGGVVSAVMPGLKPDDIENYANYTRARIIVADAETAATLEPLRPQLRWLKHVLVVGANDPAQRSYEKALAEATPDPTFAPTHRDDACVWLYTSGSTGFPKGAVHRHRDFVFNALTFGLPIVGYRKGDVCISVPRLAFGYALGTNMLFPLMAGATTVLFEDRGTPERIFELMKRHKPTIFTAVPTGLNSLLNAPGMEEADLSSLRVTISAGEALPAELYQRWKQRTGVEILDGIGSAEMFHIFITNRVGDVRLGSLGRVVDGYRAKVCDDDGIEVPRGEMGTLWVAGNSIAIEYWQNYEKSKNTFRGEWCVSADKFQQDEEGYFYFCGRGDDMLKVNGKWLSPVEVENVLLQHPAVREVAVVGFKDRDGLDKPKAFVVLHPGHAGTELIAEALKTHVRSKLAPFKAPREVVFLPVLPRSDRGKVLKTELRI